MPSAVFYDLEFTAWAGSMENRWLAPGQFREVVQIGAVKIDMCSLAALGECALLVKPRFNPVLSPYFENLTGITNAQLAERGVNFRDAYDRFVAFCDGDPIYSFGRDDLVLIDNLALYGIGDAAPLPQHNNFAVWLRANGIVTKGLHACDVAKACGAPFEGRDHDALDDARSLVAGLRVLVARGAEPPFEERP
jgi:inhibitor of KinA sporulation pathway (predicted exonuclease)